MSNVMEVTDATFDAEVKQSTVPVLVDFWAPWCGPCRALAPVIDELAAEFEGKVKIVKMNTDENMQTAQEFRISGIPSLLFFKGGQVADQLVGVQQKSALATKLTEISKN
jgi:thioredoxin 1